jgi:uncharacterized membrane protein (DUF485 family)
MICETFVTDWRLIGMAALFLVTFGVAYNWWVGSLANRKEGYVAMLVAIGVAVTLGIVAVISWQSALLVLGAFVASGTPMIVGDIVRSIRMREQAIKYQRHQIERMAAEIQHDDRD